MQDLTVLSNWYASLRLRKEEEGQKPLVILRVHETEFNLTDFNPTDLLEALSNENRICDPQGANGLSLLQQIPGHIEELHREIARICDDNPIAAMRDLCAPLREELDALEGVPSNVALVYEAFWLFRNRARIAEQAMENTRIKTELATAQAEVGRLSEELEDSEVARDSLLNAMEIIAEAVGTVPLANAKPAQMRGAIGTIRDKVAETLADDGPDEDDEEPDDEDDDEEELEDEDNPDDLTEEETTEPEGLNQGA